MPLFWNSLALLVSISLSFMAFAGTNLVTDYTQSIPELKLPVAGSLQGSLAKFNPAASDLAQGSLAFPLGFHVDESRGPLQFSPFPMYSIHNGISEWGQGFEAVLDIHRYREGGDLNFVDDDFVSPWGHLIRGADGAFYPKGLKAAVKVVIGNDQAQARLPDGTLWIFNRVIPSSVTGVAYGFALTEILSLTGDQTVLNWDDSSRPLLMEVSYGGKRGHSQPYLIRFNYENLPADNVSYSYRSRKLAQLTKRIQSVQFFDSEFSGTMARWSYTLTHEFSVYSPAFYLSSYQKTFASGSSEPMVRFAYDTFDSFIPKVKSQKMDRLAALMESVGAGAIRSHGLGFYDYDNDGLIDIEVASSHKLYKQGEEGFREIADFQPKADWQPCLPAESPLTLARHVLRLTGPYGRPLVFMNLAGPSAGTVRLLTCELDGRVVADDVLPYSFASDGLVTVGDLNGDQKPDLIRYAAGSLEFLENVSTEEQIKFQYRGTQALATTFLEQSIAVADINGDGIPDLFMNEGSFARVYFGKGNFEFLKKPLTLPYLTLGGQAYPIGDNASVSFLDANSDGLVDLAVTRGREFFLLMNQGFRFKAAPIPFTEGRENEGEALPININGSGVPMVFRSSGSTDIFGMELSRPSVGLLKSVDDGQGNVVTLSFAYQRAGQSRMFLQKQLVAIEKASLGKGKVKSTLEYGKAVFSTSIPRLLGYESVKKTDPLLETTVTFQNPEESPGLVTQVASKDLTGSNIQQNQWSDYGKQTIRGLTTWLKSSEKQSVGPGPVLDSAYSQTFLYEEQSLCISSSTASIGGDRMVTHFDYESFQGLEPGLACPVLSVKREGKHSQQEFDFVEEVRIERDSWAQPLRIKQMNGDALRLIQELSYDDLHRISSILEISGLKHTFSYQDDSRLLDEHETSIGVKTLAQERYPNGLLKTHQMLHGDEPGYQQTVAYDGFERLSERRDNLYSMPLETISYTFGSAKNPGFIRSIMNPASSVSMQADEYFAADGTSLAQIVTLDSGRYLAQLNSFASGQGYTASHAAAVVGDDFSVNWQAYQNQSRKKAEVFVDGFAKPRLTYQTHQESQVESIAERLVWPGEGLTRQRVSHGKYETLTRLDALNRVTGRRDELKNWSLYLYDIAGRLREVQLADGTKHGAQYDHWGQLVRIHRSGLGSVEYRYNERGLLEQKDFKGTDGAIYRSLALGYDVFGRLVKKVSSNGSQESSVSYYYDGFTPTPEFYPNQKGFMTAVKGPHFEKRMQYDQKGRVVLQVESLTHGGVQKTARNTYFADDRRHTSDISIGVSGRTQQMLWEYVLRSDGLLAETRLNGRVVAQLFYDDLGLLKSANLGEGRSTVTFSYDSVTSEIKSYEAVNAGHRASYQLQKDARGLIVNEELNGKARDYTYDDRSFLITSGDESFGYDRVGLMAIEPAVAAGVSFDPHGRIVQKAGFTFGYDGEGQIAFVRKDDGTVISYGYDENGLRNVKLNNGKFLSGELSGTYISQDHILVSFEVGGTAVGYIDNGNFLPLLGDLRNSIIDGGDKEKPISAYGKRTTTDTWQSVIDFAGHPRDLDTGLIRMGIRDYDPELGRFVQPDPLYFENLEQCLESPLECSLFSYAKNNPLSFTDPFGTSSADLAMQRFEKQVLSGDIKKANEEAKARAIGAAMGAGIGAGAAAALAPEAAVAVASSVSGVMQKIGLKIGLYSPLALKGLEILRNIGNAYVGTPKYGSLKIPAKDLNRVTNGAIHIFGKKNLAEHRLEGFLSKFDGDGIKAFKAIENAAQKLADKGQIQGIFRDVVINVKGADITIRGNVIDGVVKLSTAFIPKGGQP